MGYRKARKEKELGWGPLLEIRKRGRRDQQSNR
jgi:hypothetical protein